MVSFDKAFRKIAKIKQELIEEFLKEKREETKKIQEVWNDEGDFTLDEKFDIIVGFLDNQIKTWEEKLK